MMSDKEFLSLLACPKTGGALRYDKELGMLMSDKGEVMYPVVEGVPILLVEEAKPFKGKKK